MKIFIVTQYAKQIAIIISNPKNPIYKDSIKLLDLKILQQSVIWNYVNELLLR